MKNIFLAWVLLQATPTKIYFQQPIQTQESMSKQTICMHQLIDPDQIAEAVKQAAAQINQDYEGKELVIISVMKGALCLTADLMRELSIPCSLEAVQCTSYRGGMQRGELVIRGLDPLDLQGRDLLVVDDVFDSGHTLTKLVEELKKKNPSSVRSLVLLDKGVASSEAIKPDYVLFHIENEFVIGYGMDYKEQYRGLPGVYKVSKQ